MGFPAGGEEARFRAVAMRLRRRGLNRKPWAGVGGKDLGASSETSHRRTEAEGRSVACGGPRAL